MKEESGRWSREERRKKRGDKRRVEWKRERELKKVSREGNKSKGESGWLRKRAMGDGMNE